MQKLFESSRFCLALVCAAAFCIPATTQAWDDDEPKADEPKLTIGSPAPNLDIEHWVSDNNGLFQHVTEIDEGKVYVIEFWATWCRPCIIAMPHIAETQAKYEDQGVQFVSISDEDLDTVEDFLERKVSKDKEKRTYGELTNSYCLTTDPDESVKDDYFRAAGRTGMPCVFIVGKTGLIEWIGHPMKIDRPLRLVVNDDWDREEAIAELKKEQEAREKAKKLQRKMMKAMQAIQKKFEDGKEEEVIDLLDELIMDEEMAPAKSQLKLMRQQFILAKTMKAIQEKNNDDGEEAAIELIEEMLKDEDLSEIKDPLEGKRVQLMIEIGHPESAAVLRELIEENKKNFMALNQVAWGIYEYNEANGDVDKDVLAAAKEASEYAVKAAPKNGAILDTLAHLIYVVDGDLDKAIEVQKKAVKYAGRQVGEIKPFLEQLLEEKETGKKKTEADF